jgi:hypothetical protein
MAEHVSLSIACVTYSVRLYPGARLNRNAFKQASAAMFAGRPALRRQMNGSHFEWLLLQRRRERVVPAVHEAEQRDDGEYLDNLTFAPMLLHRIEHVVGDCIRL